MVQTAVRSGWVRGSGRGSDREGRKSGRVGDEVLSPGFGCPWVIGALGIEKVSE